MALSEPVRALEIRSLEELSQIASPWSMLWEACPTATPFQRPEWVLPWAKHFCSQGLSALAIYRGNDLVGLALFFRYTLEGERRIAFLGGGNSDYHELLYEPSLARAVVSSLHEHLLKTRSSWDRCDWEQVPNDSPLVAQLPALPMSVDLAQGDVCPVLRVDDSTEDFAGVPCHQAARFRKYRRRAERLAVVSLCQEDGAAIRSTLDDLFRFCASRWHTPSAAGTVTGAKSRDFLREAAESLGGSRLLRLYALRFYDRSAAVIYGFACKRTMYCYLQGFDQEFSKWSPGTLIVGSVIERARAEGLDTIDFLRGAEPYKFTWGARSRGTTTLRLQIVSSP